jgi:3-oxoacyl-[acyl-carrier-protein] synthase-3
VRPSAISQAQRDRAASRTLRHASILGLGHALPDRVVPNAEIGPRIGIDDAWIVRRTGVRARRHLRPDERMTDLAIEAARRALANAELPGSRLDRVVVATMSPDEVTPNTAPLVAHALGAVGAGAYDVDAACTGFVAALDAAASQVETRRADHVLVIGAEALSRLVDFDDPKTAFLFADGAGAVVVGPEGDGVVGPMLLRADGGIGDYIVAERDGGKLRMDGHGTFQVAIVRLVELTHDILAREGLETQDIDLFVYHQANSRILKAVGERLSLPFDRVADYVAQTANTSAASIPLTLALARDDGRLAKGDRVLVAGIGAGFTWGGGIIEWGIG